MSSNLPSQLPARLVLRRRRTRVVGVFAVAALVFGAGAAGAVLLTGDDVAQEPCPDGTRTLAVAAPPELASAVRMAAEAVTARSRPSECVDVRVEGVAASTVAAAVAAQPPRRPDVWIPDSSLWLQRLTSAGIPATGPSVARSPVVLAVSQPASRAGSADRPSTFAELLRLAGNGALRLGIAKGADDSVTISDLVSLNKTGQRSGRGRVELAATLRAASREAGTSEGDLVAAAPRSVSLMVPASERSVWAHNLRSPSSPVVAVYADGASLDYPFVVLTPNTARIRVAERLFAALRGTQGRQALAAGGFRAPDGKAPATLSGVPGIDPAAPAAGAAPSAREVAAALRVSRVVTLGTRMLAVVDVSGSMARPLPGAGGASRMQVTKGAANSGLSMYPDDTSIGLWVFATDLTKHTDYRELVPLGPLGLRPDGVMGRERLGRALADLDHVRGGGTGLYDTTLAAVRAVRKGWDPERVNSVVLLTDGQNDDEHGISLRRLLRTLQQESDPRRPVPVITIGLGEDSDRAALTAISRQTGGSTYEASKASDSYRVFREAMGRRE
ncbi:MAG TPA: substrate-binding domain-containing protein [Actinomycetales bacterium]|nr:substrate-binding domain-containing protein [Actinomycetales bacterium]